MFGRVPNKRRAVLPTGLTREVLRRAEGGLRRSVRARQATPFEQIRLAMQRATVQELLGLVGQNRAYAARYDVCLIFGFGFGNLDFVISLGRF